MQMPLSFYYLSPPAIKWIIRLITAITKTITIKIPKRTSGSSTTIALAAKYSLQLENKKTMTISKISFEKVNDCVKR